MFQKKEKNWLEEYVNPRTHNRVTISHSSLYRIFLCINIQMKSRNTVVTFYLLVKIGKIFVVKMKQRRRWHSQCKKIKCFNVMSFPLSSWNCNKQRNRFFSTWLLSSRAIIFFPVPFCLPWLSMHHGDGNKFKKICRMHAHNSHLDFNIKSSVHLLGMQFFHHQQLYLFAYLTSLMQLFTYSLYMLWL